jgi:hypothetical protein
MHARRRGLAVAVATLIATASACSDSSTAPTTLQGEYTATTFTLTQGGTTTDVLLAGGSLSITLSGNGTTTGRLFIPASLNGGTPFDVSMDGTYAESNGAIMFNQTADTFVRDVTFTHSGSTLVGSRTVSGSTISLVLAKVTPR